MNQSFLQEFLLREDFPAEAGESLIKSAGALAAGQAGALDGAVEFFRENNYRIKLTEPLVAEIAESAKLSPYTVWMLLLIEAAPPVRKAFAEEGREDLFWDTFADLKYKALECKDIYNMWGTFVAFWYPIFYTGNIVKLGRLEFETTTYQGQPITAKNGTVIKPGDRVRQVHIPSSGEPFDRTARMDAYRKAYKYFRDELNGGPLVCMCHSWLLYPEYGKILPGTSNIVSFQKDFELVRAGKSEEFGDAWRLFGKDCRKPLEDLPERTSMQRAFKKYLLNGGKTGEGLGVLIFDGKNIINR